MAEANPAGAYEQEWAEFQAANGGNSNIIPQAFKDTVDKVKEVNSKNLGFQLSYTGPFANLSQEDFIASHTGLSSDLATDDALDLDDEVELPLMGAQQDFIA